MTAREAQERRQPAPDVPADPALLSWPRTTERLLLRPFERRDAAAVLAYRGRPDVVRYLGHAPLADEESVAALMLGRARSDGAPLVRVVAVDRGTTEVVGDGVLGTRRAPALPGGLETDPGDEGWVGYCIAPEHAGRGLATELTLALLGLLLDDLGARRVVAHVFSEHEPSRRVLAKAGMRREATFVAAVRDRDGRWLDDDVWAVLAEEWRGRSAH